MSKTIVDYEKLTNLGLFLIGELSVTTLSSKFKDFLRKCLEIDPARRLDCIDLLDHPVF